MRIFLFLLFFSLPAFGQGYTEPARGTDLRKDILDALRPITEWNLGAPVEFLVDEMRVAGDAAFVSVIAQRPGGKQIEMSKVPMLRWGDADPHVTDNAATQALLVKSGRMWAVVAYAISPTDMWWAWEEYCPIWREVIPEVCP